MATTSSLASIPKQKDKCTYPNLIYKPSLSVLGKGSKTAGCLKSTSAGKKKGQSMGEHTLTQYRRSSECPSHIHSISL